MVTVHKRVNSWLVRRAAGTLEDATGIPYEEVIYMLRSYLETGIEEAVLALLTDERAQEDFLAFYHAQKKTAPVQGAVV